MAKYSVVFTISSIIDAHTPEEATELADRDMIAEGLTTHFISHYAQVEVNRLEWKDLHPAKADLSEFQINNKLQELSETSKAEVMLWPECSYCGNQKNGFGCSICVPELFVI